MVGGVVFNDMVMANDLRERWPGMPSYELAERINKKVDLAIKGEVDFSRFPSPYRVSKKLRDPQTGITHYFCEGVHPGTDYFNEYDQEYSFRGVAFRTEAIEAWERDNPWLQFHQVDENDGSDEWIWANDARNELGMTPMDFVRALNRGELETDFQESYEDYMASGLNAPFYRSSMLDELRIHRISLQRFIENNKPKKTKIDFGAALRAQTEDENVRLSAENKSLRSRVANLEAKLAEVNAAPESAEPERETQTAAANMARLKKQNKALKSGYENAAKLVCAIIQKSEKSGKPLVASEVQSLADELGVRLQADCLANLKSGMPPEFVKKTAGARPITPQEEYPDDVGT